MSEENKINEDDKVVECQNENVKDKFCSECGAGIQEGQKFCPSCGNGIKDIGPKKNKPKVNKKIIGIIAISIMLVITSVIMYSQSKEKQREEARLQYLISINSFKNKVIVAGSNIEEVSDTIQTYWSEYIFDKKHGYSIDSAVAAAMDDKSIQIDKAKKYDEELLTLYRNLKSIPEGNEDLKDILGEVDELYNSYTAFYSFAMEPSGNYTQYSSSNNDKTESLLQTYRSLDNTIKANSEFIEVEQMIDDTKENMNGVMKEYKVIYDSLPKELETDDDYKKIIPTFKEKQKIDISKVEKESEKFKEEENVNNALEIIKSASEAYDKSIEYAKKYKQSNSKEDLGEFKSAVLDFRARIAMYTLSIDSLEGDGESLNDKLK